jgi:hypothetical protein
MPVCLAGSNYGTRFPRWRSGGVWTHLSNDAHHHLPNPPLYTISQTFHITTLSTHPLLSFIMPRRRFPSLSLESETPIVRFLVPFNQHHRCTCHSCCTPPTHNHLWVGRDERLKGPGSNSAPIRTAGHRFDRRTLPPPVRRRQVFLEKPTPAKGRP